MSKSAPPTRVKTPTQGNIDTWIGPLEDLRNAYLPIINYTVCLRQDLPLLRCSYLSTLMAHKLRMDAVQSRTSSEIQISQRIQPSCHLSDVVEDVVLPYDESGWQGWGFSRGQIGPKRTTNELSRVHEKIRRKKQTHTEIVNIKVLSSAKDHREEGPKRYACNFMDHFDFVSQIFLSPCLFMVYARLDRTMWVFFRM